MAQADPWAGFKSDPWAGFKKEEPEKFGFKETVLFPQAMVLRGAAQTVGGAAGAALAPPQGILAGTEGLIERGVNAAIPDSMVREGAKKGAKAAIIPWQLKAAAAARDALVPEWINRAQTQAVAAVPKAFGAAAQAINPPSERVSEALSRTGPQVPFTGRTVGQIAFEDVPQGIGSSVPFLMGGGFAGAAGIGALSQAGNQFSETLEKTGDEKKAWTAYVAGLPSGATEALDASIAGGQLSRISKKLGGGFLTSLLVNGTAEGLQEGGQQVLQDYVDSKLTGEEKDFLRSFSHAFLVGSITGGILGGPESLQAGREWQPDAEATKRAERIGKRTEPVVRPAAATVSPEIQEQVDLFAADARKAKPPEVEGEAKPIGPVPLAEAEGLRVVEPTTPGEKWAVEAGAKFGTPIVLVERSSGGRMPLSGKRTAAGLLIDANQPSEAMVKSVALHELVHAVAGSQPTAFQSLYEELQRIDPEGIALSEKRAREEHAAAGVPFEEGSALEAEEAIARHAETLTGYLDLRLSNPERLAQLFEQKPGLARRILDWLTDTLRRLGLLKQGDSTRLNRIARSIALSPEELAVKPERAREAADAIAAAYAKLSEAAALPEAVEPGGARPSEAALPSEPAAVEPAPTQEPVQAPEAPTPLAEPASPQVKAAAVVEPRKPKMADKIRERAIKRGTFQEYVRAQGGVAPTSTEGRELAGTFSRKEFGKNPFGLGPIAHTPGSTRGKPWEQIKESAWEHGFFPGFERSADVTYAEFYEALTSNTKRAPELEAETAKHAKEEEERGRQGLSEKEYARRMEARRKRDKAAGRAEVIEMRKRKAGEDEERAAIRSEEIAAPSRKIKGVPFAVPREEPFAQMPKGKVIGYSITGEPLYSKVERGDLPRGDAGIKKPKASQIGMFDEQGGLFGQQAQERDSGAGPRFAVARPDALGFRSALEDTAEAKLPVKGTGHQFLKTLENQPGVKPEEMEWSGLRDFLKGKLIVKKSEVLDFLKQSNVKVEERTLGGPQQSDLQETNDAFIHLAREENGWTAERANDAALDIARGDADETTPSLRALFTPPDGRGARQMREAAHRLREAYLARGKSGQGPAKFQQYQTPGGSNYRELLLTIPGTNFKAGHFGEVSPDVVVHMRVNDRQSVPVAQANADRLSADSKLLADLAKRPAFQAKGLDGIHIHEREAVEASVVRAIGNEQIRRDVIAGIPVEVMDEIVRGKSTPEQLFNNKAMLADSLSGNANADVPLSMSAIRGLVRSVARLAAKRVSVGADLAGVAEGGSAAPEAGGSHTPKRMLFIEEIQSDLHQKGRREGYRQGPEVTAPLDAEYRRLVHKNADARDAGREPDPADVQRAKDLEAQLHTMDFSKIPDAPFKKTWHELALKRAIRYAAENGYDSVGWTTGEMQAERYDLSKHVQSIHVDRLQGAEDHIYSIQAQRHGAHDQVDLGAHTAKELPEVVGKDLADKIIGNAEHHQDYSGLDLKVGGEGMRGFYDKMLPAAANKIGKVGGAEVGEAKLFAREAHGGGRGDISGRADKPSDTATVHSLPITPALRTVAMEQGFNRFAVARNMAHGEEGFDVAAPGRADRAYANIVSEFDRIREVEKGAKVPLQGETISRALTLMPGRIFHKQEQARERIFDAERKIIAETGMPAHVSTEKEVSASDFLYATHAPRGNKVLAADNPDLGEELNPGTGMKTSEAKALTKKALASKNAPAYRELQRLNRERNALMLDTWVEGDLVSKERGDELRERWGEDFVPLQTIEEPETLFPRKGKGLGVSGKEYKRRKGRSTKADSPLAFAEATLQQAIERAENNNIGNLLGELAEQNPDMDLRVEADRNKIAHNEEGLSFKKNGEQIWLVTSDKDLIAAFKRLGPEAGTILKKLDPINRFLRHVIIDWNFAWPFGNAAKDILTSSIKHTIATGDNIGAGAKAGAIVAANAPKAMRAAWRVLKDPNAKGYWDDRVRESRAAGGHIGWSRSFGEIKERVRSFETAKRRAFPLRAAVAYGRLMETLGKAVEVGTRVATYDYHIKHGKNAEDAAVAMRRITTDFAVKGHWAPIYRRLYLFSGSSVQGTFGPGGVVDVLRKNPGRGATVAGALVGAGFVSALASFAFGDDDELAKLSEDDKARFQGVMVGDTRIGSLAPWGFNVFPYLGWKLAEIATGRSKATALPGQMLTAAIDSFSPLPQGANVWQSITPTALRPGMELSQNLKYSGAPIMPPENPYARAKTPAHLRKFKNVSPVFDATTTALSKVGIEVSPEALEHLFEAATGGIGTQTNRVVNVASKVIKGDADEVRLSDIPIVRSFAQQASRGSEARLFYENLTRIAEEAASRKRGESFDADVLRWEKFSKLIEKQIGKLKDRLDVTKDDETKKKLEERIEFLRGRLNKAMREPVGAR